VFWVYCIFVGALIACCAWLLLAPAQAPAHQGPAGAWPVPPPGPAPDPSGDRIPAMAGAPDQATAATVTGTPPSQEPVSREPGTSAAPLATPSTAGDPSANPGDSPAGPAAAQETGTSAEHIADPARPADPAP
jgi:hypothetical protein